MEKIPPISASSGTTTTTTTTGKRRGGSRKACNECKQQKVSAVFFHAVKKMK